MSQCKCDLLSHSLCTSCTNQGSLTSLLVVFWFVFWFAVVSVCCFGFALILFGMVMASLDCVLVLLQHGLLWPIFSPRWMNSNATINAKHAACKYSVWIDLAKAKRRREEKKGSLTSLLTIWPDKPNTAVSLEDSECHAMSDSSFSGKTIGKLT